MSTSRRLLRLAVLLGVVPCQLCLAWKIASLDPVRIGHVQVVTSAPPDSRTLTIKTLSVSPPIFSIPDLLNETEADAIVDSAQEAFWQVSGITGEGVDTHDDNLDDDGLEQMRKLLRNAVSGDFDNTEGLIKFMGGMMEEKHKIAKRSFAISGRAELESKLQHHDVNGDGALDIVELRSFARDVLHIPTVDTAAYAALTEYLSDKFPLEKLADTLSSMERSNALQEKSSESLSLEKLVLKNVPEFFSHLLEVRPHFQHRWSNETHVQLGDPAVQAFLLRAQAISRLPWDTVMESEDVQVVRYDSLGHYSCHYDRSQASGMRLATLGVFLNTPEEGGETAFPAALKPESASWGEADWLAVQKECSQFSKCSTMGGVVVPPRKGSGIFWYNVDPADVSSGIMNTILRGSLHCGAQVRKGRKWFANLWFRTDKYQSRGRPEPSLKDSFSSPSPVSSEL